MQKLVSVLATTAALLWSIPASAGTVPHFFEGTWGTTEQDCADSEGPSYRLTIGLNARVGNKTYALADSYEDHCVINDIGIDEKANVAGAELTCYPSLQDLRMRRRGRKVSEAWILDRGVLRARARSYRQCDGNTFAVTPDMTITASPVDVPTCSRAGCEGTMINISGQDTDQATATVVVSEEQASKYCTGYMELTDKAKIKVCADKIRRDGLDKFAVTVRCSRGIVLDAETLFRYREEDGRKTWLANEQEQAPSSNIVPQAYFNALCPATAKWKHMDPEGAGPQMMESINKMMRGAAGQPAGR